MLRAFRHIIWDWNGTLFDDAWLCIEIINCLLGARALPLVDGPRYQEEFTFPVREYYRRLGFDFSRESFEMLAAEYVAEYDRRRFECALQPGATAILETLAGRGHTLSILSAYEQARLEEMAAFTGVHGRFARLVGLDDYYADGKVHRGRALMRELDCRPEAAVLVGDTLHDAEVAEALGIACVLIPSGHQSPARLSAATAAVLDSLDALLAQ